MRKADFERRLQQLENDLVPEPGIYLFFDENGAERVGTLEEMIENHGDFQRTIKVGSLQEGYRLIDYICELWGGTVIS